MKSMNRTVTTGTYIAVVAIANALVGPMAMDIESGRVQ